MIDFSAKENNLTGKVDILYAGTELQWQKLIVNLETCSQLVFTNSSNPVLLDFLMGKSKIELDFKTSGVFEVELFFLYPFSADLLVTNVNLLQAVNILHDFYDSNSVFIGDVEYGIDKSKSTDNSLFLDRPIESSGNVWRAKKLKKSFSYLGSIKKKLVDRVLTERLSLKDHQEISFKSNIIHLIEDENDADKQHLLFKLL